MFSECLFQMLINLERKTMLQKSRDILSIVPMAITYGEEMTVSEVQHMWVGQICILIYLVWVVSGNSSLCGERELCNDVVDLGCSILCFR